MGLIGSFWMFALGVVGLLDRSLSHRFAADGTLETRHGGAVVWSILAFAIGGTSVLWGAWGLLSSALNVGWLQIMPLYWLLYLAFALVQAGLGTLMVVGGIRKLNGKSSYMPVAVMIFSISALALGVTMVVSTFLFLGR